MAARFGFYDINYVFSLYLWEFEALIKGVKMSQIDQMETNAVGLFNERYVMNAKKPKMNKVFNRTKMERQLDNMFDENTQMKSYDNKKRQLEARDRVRRAFS